MQCRWTEINFHLFIKMYMYLYALFMEIYCFCFIFSEADTEDSQRSTDANTDLSHMKMIFFGNRKKLHVSI